MGHLVSHGFTVTAANLLAGSQDIAGLLAPMKKLDRTWSPHWEIWRAQRPNALRVYGDERRYGEPRTARRVQDQIFLPNESW
jgi:hypothetical protein